LTGYVLDANALMAFFEDRPGARKVEGLLQEAEITRPLVLSVIHWGEVYYSLWRIRGRAVAREKLEEISRLPVEVVDVDQATAELAAAFKAEHNLPYVDSFAAAMAVQRRATLVTGDRDFGKIEKGVKILWTDR